LGFPWETNVARERCHSEGPVESLQSNVADSLPASTRHIPPSRLEAGGPGFDRIGDLFGLFSLNLFKDLIWNSRRSRASIFGGEASLDF
jgi:hypothetical protein